MWAIVHTGPTKYLSTMSCVCSTHHALLALNSFPSCLQRILLALSFLLFPHAPPGPELFFLLPFPPPEPLLSLLALPESFALAPPALSSALVLPPLSSPLPLAPPALSSLPLLAPPACACFLPFSPILEVPHSSAPLALLLPLALSSISPFSLYLLLALALALAFAFFPPLALCFPSLPVSPLPVFLLLSLALAISACVTRRIFLTA